MNKNEVIKKYGNARCQEMHFFLDKLNRYHSFTYSEENLYDFVVDLERFKKRDLFEALKMLSDRESKYPLNFPEIKRACKDARTSRKRMEEMNTYIPEREQPRPIPAHVKEKLAKIFKSDDAGSENG